MRDNMVDVSLVPAQYTCFKAYDVRGKLGSEFNPEIAYRIGRAYGQIYQPETVAIGADIRLTSEELKQATIAGLTDAGVDVIDLGMTGTEEVYFAALHRPIQGGIQITASHNPIDYNGMKLVGEQARPLGRDTGLTEIQALAESGEFISTMHKGTVTQKSILAEYIEHLLSYLEYDHVRPLKLLVNAGNGAAGHVIDALEQEFLRLQLPLQFIKIHHEPDGTFPHGIPNPLILENRLATTQAVQESGADIGIAWDGDFDRCFLFDEQGVCIEGYYIVGLLAQAFLLQYPGETIVHDPRLMRNTLAIVQSHKGNAVVSPSGHSFIKQVMRDHNAVYGGEMSSHHYFRDFGYCDSGMIPWLLVVMLLSKTGKSLSSLVSDMIARFPCSGEINFVVDDVSVTLDRILEYYADQSPQVDRLDGLSLDFGHWRCNIRASQTEPLIRLNIETRQSPETKPMAQYVNELSALIQGNM